MIALSIYMLLVLAVAYMEAVTDALTIAEGRKIDHAAELRDRVILCLGAGLFMAGLSRNMEWRTLLWLPAAWGLFTAAFRWILNGRRKLDWRYVSPSNWYDRIFLGYGIRRMGYWDIMAAKSSHMALYPLMEKYASDVHRAGAIAYAFEGIILVASLILYAWTQKGV